jgi:tRNA threonylcarbamoyladenosine biosynthesis protein TsaB
MSLVVLGIDTATWTAAVGVVRDGAVLAEEAERTERSHAASLPLLIERVLARAGVMIAEVDGVAVSIGPGSFTGLRIGLGLAKGIVFAGGAQLAAVPTLEALALAAEATPGATVCAALDARKREVYAALFRVTAPDMVERLSPDEALHPEALAARLPPGVVLVGDAGAVYADVLGVRATVRPFDSHHPRGGIVARLGWNRLVAGEAVNAGTVEPAYVRPPEAELPRPGSR